MTVSPPFNINETLPGDSDIVSQHPANARVFRDTVESWLKVNHNVNGRHDGVEIDHHADAAFPGTAAVSTIWASSTGNANGRLKWRNGTGAIQYLDGWPGDVKASAQTGEHGDWKFANGQALSRSTFADLFGVLGTTFGAGDGSTTFNVMDLRGRVIAGQDDMGGASANRLTGVTGGIDGDVFGATGGQEAHALTQGELPNVAFTISGIALNDPGHFHFEAANATAGVCGSLSNTQQIAKDSCGGGDGATALSGTSTAATIGKSSTETTGITVSNQGTAASGGSGTAHNVVQPTMILNYFVRA